MSAVKVRKRKGSGHETRRSDDTVTLPVSPGEDNASYINDQKWKKILSDEERDITALQLREEVFETVFQLCYQKYLEEQVIDFTVHCAYKAFLKVVSVYFIKLDPGEKPEANNPAWQPDKEPEKSPMDAWLTRCIPVEEKAEQEEPPGEPRSASTEESAEKVSMGKASEKSGGLGDQVYTRYYPSTEWPPEALESVERRLAKPPERKASPATTAGTTSSKEKQRPSPNQKASTARRNKDSAATQPSRRSQTAAQPSKSTVKKTDSPVTAAETVGLPRPPVIHPSTLPQSRVEVKYTVLPLEDEASSDTASSVKRQPSVRRQASSVRRQPSRAGHVRFSKSVNKDLA